MSGRTGPPFKYVFYGIVLIGFVYMLYVYNATNGKLRDAEHLAERYRREEESKVTQLQELMKSKDELQAKCDNDRQDFVQRLNSINQSHKMLQGRNEEVEADYGRLQQEVQKLKEDQEHLESQRNQEFQQLKQEKELEIASAKDQVANYQRQNEQLQNEISSLKAQIQNSQTQLQYDQTVISNLDQEVTRLKQFQQNVYARSNMIPGFNALQNQVNNGAVQQQPVVQQQQPVVQQQQQVGQQQQLVGQQQQQAGQQPMVAANNVGGVVDMAQQQMQQQQQQLAGGVQEGQQQQQVAGGVQDGQQAVVAGVQEAQQQQQAVGGVQEAQQAAVGGVQAAGQPNQEVHQIQPDSVNQVQDQPNEPAVVQAQPNQEALAQQHQVAAPNANRKEGEGGAANEEENEGAKLAEQNGQIFKPDFKGNEDILKQNLEEKFHIDRKSKEIGLEADNHDNRMQHNGPVNLQLQEPKFLDGKGDKPEEVLGQQIEPADAMAGIRHIQPQGQMDIPNIDALDKNKAGNGRGVRVEGEDEEDQQYNEDTYDKYGQDKDDANEGEDEEENDGARYN